MKPATKEQPSNKSGGGPKKFEEVDMSKPTQLHRWGDCWLGMPSVSKAGALCTAFRTSLVDVITDMAAAEVDAAKVDAAGVGVGKPGLWDLYEENLLFASPTSCYASGVQLSPCFHQHYEEVYGEHWEVTCSETMEAQRKKAVTQAARSHRDAKKPWYDEVTELRTGADDLILLDQWGQTEAFWDRIDRNQFADSDSEPADTEEEKETEKLARGRSRKVAGVSEKRARGQAAVNASESTAVKGLAKVPVGSASPGTTLAASEHGRHEATH